MKTGTVKNWNGNRGFGFVKPDGGGDDVFIHVRQLPDGMDHLNEGQRVSFEEEISKKTNRNQAVRVELI